VAGRRVSQNHKTNSSAIVVGNCERFTRMDRCPRIGLRQQGLTHAKDPPQLWDVSLGDVFVGLYLDLVFRLVDRERRNLAVKA
jgi:hypothetical protein